MTIIDEFSGRDRIIAPVMEEAGFAVGVLRGTRSFLVDKYGRLTGVTYQQVWTPGENIANCRRNDTYDALTFAIWAHGSQMVRSSRPEPEPHPLRDCRHGFYGYYDGSDDYHKEGMISGVVEGFGECVVGTRGFRSMKARIVALHIPDDVPAHVRRMIARNYKDTPILDSFEQMVAEFPTDSAGAEYTPENDPEFWTRES